MLNPEEYNRYNRHLLLSEIGESGQLKLKNAKVLVIGAGGLGCPALQYLTAAGVGTIGIVDFDVVEYSNLQRQILYTDSMVGKNKAKMAADVLLKLNPQIHINTYPYRLSTDNALGLIEEYDIVLDGTDNFSSRYMINDACAILKKPLVFASMYKFEGQLSVFHLTDNSPTYRCLFPEPPSEEAVPNCSETGVIGVLPGIMGSLQASEAIKLITGIGEPLDGKLVCYNNLNQNWLTLSVKRNEDIVNKFKLSREEFKKKTYDSSCYINKPVNRVNDITANTLLEKPDKFRIIDIREYHETPELEFNHVERVPLSAIGKEQIKFGSDKPTVVVCQRGIRSKRLIEEVLTANPDINNLYNLEGGVLALVTVKNNA